MLVNASENTVPADQPADGATPDLQAGSKKFDVENLSAWFGEKKVLHGIDMQIQENRVTAIIGPSGCGKSTFIRCLNRMHEMVPGARNEGRILLDGQDIFSESVDPVLLRRRVGMVFQKPNPFVTMSIRDNVLAGLKLTRSLKREMGDEIVERALRRAALWDEVSDRLREPGAGLRSGHPAPSRACGSGNE